jgi:hypothetical protein
VEGLRQRVGEGNRLVETKRPRCPGGRRRETRT